MSTPQIIQAVKNSLSAPRLSTYEAACSVTTPDDPAALRLYAWNAQVSGALMTPLHICEVTIRNAVSENLEGMFGARWPWSVGLIQSLPAPAYGYNPRQDLVVTRRRHPTTGKVIPELKFVFWQKMFTGRYDFRLWNAHIRTAFPNTDPAHATSQIRAFLYDELDHIRTLRNRIAHHEPIFTRDLQSDLERIEKLINLRCSMTATWMMNNQQASAIIAARP